MTFISLNYRKITYTCEYRSVQVILDRTNFSGNLILSGIEGGGGGTKIYRVWPFFLEILVRGSKLFSGNLGPRTTFPGPKFQWQTFPPADIECDPCWGQGWASPEICTLESVFICACATIWANIGNCGSAVGLFSVLCTRVPDLHACNVSCVL